MLDLFPSKKKRFEIDMAPLIDVVFLLLLFFMLTFAIQGQGLSISLPEGEETQNEEKDIIVKIARNNNLHRNNKNMFKRFQGIGEKQNTITIC